MTPSQLTVLLASLLVLSLVFLAIAFTLWRGKEHPRRLFARSFERDGESVMGEHLREYKRRLSVHRLVNSFHTGLETVASFAEVAREQFADVSFWQGLINWNKMADKSSRVVIRAGQNIWIDMKWWDNWSGAKVRGMRRGCYHFYDGRVSPGLQAAQVANLVKHDMPEDIIWIDWEKNFGGPHEGLKNVVAFMQEIERLLPGVRVGLYTGYYFFIENSNPVWNAAQYKYLADKPLWLAWYGGSPRIPRPWTQIHYHQWGTPTWGYEWGVESKEIDMNSNMAGDVVTPPHEPEEPGDTMQYKFIIGTNERTGPGTQYVPTGRFYEIGEIVNVVDTVPVGFDVWGKLDNGKYAAIKYNGLIRAEPIATPPPPSAFDLQVDRVDITVHATRLSDGSKWRAMYTQAGLGLVFERVE